MFARAMDFLLMAAALSAAGLTFAAFREGYSAIPWADAWLSWQHYADAGFEIRLRDLFGFHSEHRPFFARLPLLLDMRWLGARSILPFGVTFAAMAAHAWLLWWIMRRQPWYDTGKHWAFAVALAIFCCFSPAQLENVLWNFQTTFVLHFVFATGAFALAAGGYRFAAILCGTCAALCLASGVLVWWMLILMALAIRCPWRTVLLYFGAAAAGTGVYLVGYQQPASHSNPLETIARPLELAHYIAIYFGASWATFETGFGELLWVGACAFCAWRLWTLLRSGSRAVADEIVPYAVMAFTLAAAAITALGRLRFGLEQAGSSRYQTCALLFWWAAAAIVLPYVRGMWVQPSKAFLAGAMAAVFASTPFIMGRAYGHRWVLNASEAAWVSGVDDRKVIDVISEPSPLPAREGFAARSLGLFSREPGSWMGRAWAPEALETCSGQFRRAGFMEGSGQRLRGGAFFQGSPVRDLVVVDRGRKVVGVGVEDTAYAAVAARDETLKVFGLLSGGRACSVSIR